MVIGSDYKEFKYLCKRIDKNTLLVKQNMALYLSAEQKNLKSLFSNDNRYIIPNYQRHYSWTMEQCRQLYDDIMDAYSNGTDSYFWEILYWQKTSMTIVQKLLTGNNV